MMVFSCGGDDALEYAFEGCSESGARDLRAEHREILEYAGWLEYVRDHVGRIDYYDDRSASADGKLGYAICQPGECYIEIATKNRSDVDIGATLVHEAAHLDGGCKSETLPRQMHQQFYKDYYARADRGEIFSKNIPYQEIIISGSIQDAYPHPASGRIALILEDKEDGFQTNLYVYHRESGETEQISPDSGKRIRFPRQYSASDKPVYLNQLAGPWSSDGQKILTIREDREGNEELTVFDISEKNGSILSVPVKAGAAVFSPDDAYLAVSPAASAAPVQILDAGSGEILQFLPAYYIGENRMPAWADENTLLIYNRSQKQIDSFDIHSAVSQVIYKLEEKDIEVIGLYASAWETGTVCALISTASSQGYKKIIRISHGGPAEVLLENMRGNAPPSFSFPGDRMAFFSHASETSPEAQLMIRNPATGTEESCLDPFSQKGAVFFLSGDQLLLTTVRLNRETFRFDYRLWLLNFRNQKILLSSSRNTPTPAPRPRTPDTCPRTPDT
jgi:hypothetical protein